VAVLKTLLAIGPILVGAVLLWTGVIKSVAPYSFREHLKSLGRIPPTALSTAVVLAAALEATWGTALIVNVLPSLVLPLSAGMLGILTTISWWGVKSGKASDCGCYGGFIEPSIGQSAAINGTFAALLIAWWMTGLAQVQTPAWKIIILAAVLLIVGGFAALSLQSERRNGRPIVDTNPLKVGARWNDRWAGRAGEKQPREFLVSWLGPDCSYCKQWVKAANAISQSDELPPIYGVAAAPQARIDEFMKEYEILFPVRRIPDSVFRRLVRGVPMTVRIVDGRVAEIWGSRMPMEFVVRMKTAFFPEYLLRTAGFGSTQ
jgi:hypothetical protein